jgi:glycyl-tRNA synthetase
MLPQKLQNFNRTEFEDTCKRKFFFDSAFDLYGGVAGLYDYGPVLCAIKNNFIQEWRRHFIIEENMCEIECTCVTPEEVFIHSGHVARFNDVMCRDIKTGECFRLDKHLENVLEEILNINTDPNMIPELKQLLIDVGSMKLEALKEVVEKYNVKSPKGNPLSEPFPFNLMFKNAIGPDGTKVGYLRPELAQGIFMNFKRLMDTYYGKQIPFAIASIGQAFRNEIAPRNSLLRVREFTLAEIEHFVDPNNKKHAKFDLVKDVSIFAWNRDHQATGKEPTLSTIGDLVANKIIDNETLGYFIARTQLFLQSVGIKYARFRQHRKDEMAHYAQDCWDAECLTSYGWVECVGIADRSAYDLTQHSNGSGKELFVREELETPIVVEKKKIVVDNKELVKKTFDKNAGRIINTLEKMSVTEEMLENFRNGSGEIKLSFPEKDNSVTKQYIVTKDMYDIVTECEKQTFRKYIPNVIEPSFGIGRILYSCLEQNYFVRKTENKEEKRAGFSILPNLAYRKVAVVALVKNIKFEPLIKQLCTELNDLHITFYTDDSGISIGRKYARMDELGIPYCITCDFEEDGCVTLRERDSTKQVRIPIIDVTNIVEKLCRDKISWDDLQEKYK